MARPPPIREHAANDRFDPSRRSTGQTLAVRVVTGERRRAAAPSCSSGRGGGAAGFDVRRPRDAWWATALVVVLVTPLFASAVDLWFSVGRSYLPTIDWAVLELRVRDVFHHAVLVGPYSRYGWNQPGPLLFYALAGPYRLLGSRSVSMHIGALGVNAASIAAIGWVAFRRGRLPMTLCVLIPVGLVTHALGANFLRDPWNPSLPVLPLLLVLLLAWSVTVGDVWMLPIAVGVASFVVQCHVGLAPFTLALVASAVLGMVVAEVRARSRPSGAARRLIPVAVVSAVVLVGLWAPVLYGTFVEHDGNLGRMWRFFRMDHPTAGASTALKVLGWQWGPRPEWILGARGTDVFGGQVLDERWWMALGLVAAGIAVGVAIRRRVEAVVWLAGLVAVGFVVATVAVSNIIGVVFPYLTRWTWVLGVGIGVLVLQGLWLSVAPRHRAAVLRCAIPVTLVMLVGISAAETVDALNAGVPLASQQPGARAIASQVIAKLPRGDRPVLVDTSYGTAVGPGLVLQLERRGVPVVVRPDSGIIYGRDRVAGAGPYRATLTMVSGAQDVRSLRLPGARIAHYVERRTPATAREIREFVARAHRLPPSSERTALLGSLRRQLTEPASEVAVYLSG
jgi:hypothetical protein